jgi:hypothetical protein
MRMRNSNLIGKKGLDIGENSVTLISMDSSIKINDIVLVSPAFSREFVGKVVEIKPGFGGKPLYLVKDEDGQVKSVASGYCILLNKITFEKVLAFQMEEFLEKQRKLRTFFDNARLS